MRILSVILLIGTVSCASFQVPQDQSSSESFCRDKLGLHSWSRDHVTCNDGTLKINFEAAGSRP